MKIEYFVTDRRTDIVTHWASDGAKNKIRDDRMAIILSFAGNCWLGPGPGWDVCGWEEDPGDPPRPRLRGAGGGGGHPPLLCPCVWCRAPRHRLIMSQTNIFVNKLNSVVYTNLFATVAVGFTVVINQCYLFYRTREIVKGWLIFNAQSVAIVWSPAQMQLFSSFKANYTAEQTKVVHRHVSWFVRWVTWELSNCHKSPRIISHLARGHLNSSHLIVQCIGL